MAVAYNGNLQVYSPFVERKAALMSVARANTAVLLFGTSDSGILLQSLRLYFPFQHCAGRCPRGLRSNTGKFELDGRNYRSALRSLSASMRRTHPNILSESSHRFANPGDCTHPIRLIIRRPHMATTNTVRLQNKNLPRKDFRLPDNFQSRSTPRLITVAKRDPHPRKARLNTTDPNKRAVDQGNLVCPGCPP